MKTDISTRDADTIKRLAAEIYRIGSLPVQQEKADMWRRVNDREPVRPMVYVNEEPWAELSANDVDGELACVCEDRFLRRIEGDLRRTLYRWRHYPVDMVVRPEIACPKAFRCTGIGISQKGDTISGLEDIDKIKMPEVTANADETERRRTLLGELLADVAPVRVSGIHHLWFTPWDILIRLVDMQSIMMDLIERPDFVEAMVSRFVDARMHELDQYEDQGLLDAGAGNLRVGSGGYGYVTGLPAPDEGPADGLRCDRLWGCGNAQIFSEISPDMHWQFSLKHEMRWLERWGLTYYGCCEPLHLKVGILDRIPNLRKISVSPWFDIARGLENGAGKYVLSVKPNPAVFAEESFNADHARADIVKLLDQAAGCSVELVMKDISTVQGDPSRLQRWGEIAMDEVEKRG
jgi:hypothetical protein